MESEETSVVNDCQITIKHELCLSCAACPPVCHSGALVLAALYLELTPELCDNCLLCIPVCPVGALLPDENENDPDTHERPDPL